MTRRVNERKKTMWNLVGPINITEEKLVVMGNVKKWVGCPK